MEAFIFFLALIPIALVVLMIMLLSKISGLSREMEATRQQLAAFMRTGRSAQGSSGTVPPDPTPAAVPPSTPVVVPEPPPPPIPTVLPPPPPITTSAPPARPPEPTPAELQEEEMRRRRLAAMLETGHLPTAASRRPAAVAVDAPGSTVPRPPVPPRPQESKRSPSFWERNPDLEKFIGENLMNKIGITVLVIGIGFLLRYAIDRELISETAQVMIGLLAGGILVFFAHRLRNSFRAFSSVLVAGGISVFYFSIATAFHEYHIIGQTAAFMAMIAITAVAVLLTLAYDRKELAVIALLGGFATPFMVSTGENNYMVLFTYLLILNTGMLVLSNYKKWHIINVICFVLTLLLFGGWLLDDYTGFSPPPAMAAFGFATAFFLVFFAMNLSFNLRHRKAFQPQDHALLLVNTAAYYAAGMFVLSDLTVRVTGLFTVLLGLFYLVFAMYFHRREGIPASLRYLLIGLVLTFISLAAPVQLEGNHITLFWAAEAVLLLWFSQRIGIRLVERSALIVSGLMVISLWMDLSDIYGGVHSELLRPLFNKGWITGMISSLSLALLVVLIRRSDTSVELLPGFRRSYWSLYTVVMALGIVYLVNYLEIRHQLERIYLDQVVDMALMCWTLFFLLVVDVFLRRKEDWRVVPIVLLAITAILYITVFYMSSRSAFSMLVAGENGAGVIVFHYLGMVLMVLATITIIGAARALIPRRSDGWKINLWAITIFLVVFASQELDHALILSNWSTEGLTAGRRIGYPILWGISSFLFMWLGMRRRQRMLRVIALSLFAFTLLKLFLFDIGSLSEGGRVAAFIFLGILLLVISFMYQKLKGLVMADGTEAPIDDHDE